MGRRRGCPSWAGVTQHTPGIPQQLVSPRDRRNISGRISSISSMGAAGSASSETQPQRLTPLIREELHHKAVLWFPLMSCQTAFIFPSLPHPP